MFVNLMGVHRRCYNIIEAGFFAYRLALLPSKDALGDGSEKEMKTFNENSIRKSKVFLRWLRTTFGVILFAFFTLFQFSKKFEKSMPKGSPKVVIFDQKCDLGRSKVDLSDIF